MKIEREDVIKIMKLCAIQGDTDSALLMLRETQWTRLAGESGEGSKGPVGRSLRNKELNASQYSHSTSKQSQQSVAKTSKEEEISENENENESGLETQPNSILMVAGVGYGVEEDSSAADVRNRNFSKNETGLAAAAAAVSASSAAGANVSRRSLTSRVRSAPASNSSSSSSSSSSSTSSSTSGSSILSFPSLPSSTPTPSSLTSSFSSDIDSSSSSSSSSYPRIDTSLIPSSLSSSSSSSSSSPIDPLRSTDDLFISLSRDALMAELAIEANIRSHRADTAEYEQEEAKNLFYDSSKEIDDEELHSFLSRCPLFSQIDSDISIQLYELMRIHRVPISRPSTYHSLISHCCHYGATEKASEILLHAVEAGVFLSPKLYVEVLISYCQDGQMEKAMEWMKKAKEGKLSTKSPYLPGDSNFVALPFVIDRTLLSLLYSSCEGLDREAELKNVITAVFGEDAGIAGVDIMFEADRLRQRYPSVYDAAVGTKKIRRFILTEKDGEVEDGEDDGEEVDGYDDEFEDDEDEYDEDEYDEDEDDDEEEDLVFDSHVQDLEPHDPDKDDGSKRN